MENVKDDPLSKDLRKIITICPYSEYDAWKGEMGMYHQQQNMYETCKNHMHRYVRVQTADQQFYDGFVENVDQMNLYLAVPVSGDMQREVHEERLVGGLGFGPGLGFGFPGFGYPGWGYPGFGYPGFGYPVAPGWRFRRFILPLAAITALTLLPYY